MSSKGKNDSYQNQSDYDIGGYDKNAKRYNSDGWTEPKLNSGSQKSVTDSFSDKAKVSQNLSQQNNVRIEPPEGSAAKSRSSEKANSRAAKTGESGNNLIDFGNSTNESNKKKTTEWDDPAWEILTK